MYIIDTFSNDEEASIPKSVTKDGSNKVSCSSWSTTVGYPEVGVGTTPIPEGVDFKEGGKSENLLKTSKQRRDQLNYTHMVQSWE